jgi:hypothetical protein
MEIPKSRQECTKQLQAVRTEIKTLVQESYQRQDQERNNRIQELEQSLLTADKAEATRLRKFEDQNLSSLCLISSNLLRSKDRNKESRD